MSNLSDIIAACRYLIKNSPEGEDCRNYLNGRLNTVAQEKFSFGYFPNTEKLDLIKSFFSEEELKELGLLYSKEVGDANGAHCLSFCYFENNPLVMPYRDVYGNVIGIVGRSLFSDSIRNSIGIAKYKNTRFAKGNHLFGLYEAKEEIMKSGFVYVVEGQFDVIKAVEKGLKNIVSLGSADMSPYQFSLICRYTNNIILLLDNDEAGERGRKRAIDKYSSFANISNVFLPMGYKDIDEYIIDCPDIEEMSLITKNVDLL
jgi:DNA primase catalytic core